ncbi:MAG: T9SS C-terminal target domain-containing protein [Bacteroidetes bacterium]|nr:MAG: T9SS C-terminal target domain-containing protein [Bacteroidota bacterium]
MKKTLLTLFLAFSLTMVMAQTAPDFTFTDIDGNSHTLSEALEEGKVVIIDFFFVDCGPCVSWAPEIDQLIADFEGTTVEVWSISDRDSDTYIGNSVFNPTHSNHIAGGVAGGGDDVIDLYANNFSFYGFPTFAVVCTDGSITWDIWPLSSGVPEIRGELTEDCGVAELTGVREIAGLKGMKLSPNPTSDQSLLEFSLNQPTALGIEVFNALGQKVKTITSTAFSNGNHQVNLDVADLASGMYFVRMTSEKGVQTMELSVSK